MAVPRALADRRRAALGEFAARSKQPTVASLALLTEREREVMALVGIGL